MPYNFKITLTGKPPHCFSHPNIILLVPPTSMPEEIAIWIYLTKEVNKRQAMIDWELSRTATNLPEALNCITYY